jgi:Tol biopolymer transport system component
MLGKRVGFQLSRRSVLKIGTAALFVTGASRISMAGPPWASARVEGQAIMPQAEGEILKVRSRRVLFSDPRAHLTPGAWSPDGKAFLFNKLTDRRTSEAIDPKTKDRYSMGIYELWEYSLDTGRQTKLSDNGFGGSWSPYGRQIHFLSYNSDGQSVVGRTLDLATGTTTAGVTSESTWLQQSPSGLTAFVRAGQLYAMGADGRVSSWGGITTDDPTQARFWLAPDGSAIAFASGKTLAVSSLPGVRATVAGDYEFGQSYVSWSPDGKRLVYRGASAAANVGVIDVT